MTTGHYALFDSYWEWTSQDPNEGILHTNECPPLLVETKQGRKTVTTRTASNIDIDEAIIHVLDKHQVDVVATNAEATAGQISLEEYPRLRVALGLGADDPVPAGTRVWWLQLNDPDSSAEDETSDLSLGFSAALFDKQYWLTAADGQPMRYMLETERYPGGEANNVPHILAYEAPQGSNATQEAILDSTNTDVDLHDMRLDPGETRALQWIFTTEGTYVLSVHLQGFVRPDAPDDAGADWKPISRDYVVSTGEVRNYVIQVGDTLEETEPPIFGVHFSATENAPAGTEVGGPIPVYNADADTLYYELGGEDHDHFRLVASSGPHAVQLVVADGAELDYETRPAYDLTLSVSDRLDHEHNRDLREDDILIVRIDLEDVPVHATMEVDIANPRPGQTVTVTGTLHEAGELERPATFTFSDSSGPELTPGTFDIWKSGAGTEIVNLTVSYLPKGGTAPQDVRYVQAEAIAITWSNP